MDAVGVVCEFDPLHRGHERLLRRAGESGRVLVCAMSGNFTQRGRSLCGEICPGGDGRALRGRSGGRAAHSLGHGHGGEIRRRRRIPSGPMWGENPLFRQ